jgi:hypothetical protein
MPTIQILVHVTKDVFTPADDLSGQGHRSVFTNDLALERYDDSTPGNGLPVAQHDRSAGTHSGVATVVRVAAADDDFFPPDSVLFQYEATYKFNALDDTPLQKGQVTAQGLFDRQCQRRQQLGHTKQVCDHWRHGALLHSSWNDY